jgi:cytochrome c-type biogenesis protein CcmH/NrfF
VSTIAWWAIPLGATFLAIVVTSILARRERRRSDDAWRAKRFVKNGRKLMGTRVPGEPPPSDRADG